MKLKDITEAKIYAAVSKMRNRKVKERWEKQAEAAKRKRKEIPAYSEAQVTTATKAKHLAIMKSLLRTAEREWKWLEKSPVIKVPTVREKRVRWLEVSRSAKADPRMP